MTRRSSWAVLGGALLAGFGGLTSQTFADSTADMLRPEPSPVPAQVMWTKIQLGAYSGRPGFYVRLGTKFQVQMDALVMTEDAYTQALAAASDLKLGALKTCEAKGAQQLSSYSIFALRDCK